MLRARDTSSPYWELALDLRFDLLNSEAYVDGSNLLWFKSGCGTESGLKKAIAKELSSIQNVAKLYIQGLRADTDTHICSALAPFDLQWWTHLKSDESLRLGFAQVLLVGFPFNYYN